jgi:hypothetical protein
MDAWITVGKFDASASRKAGPNSAAEEIGAALMEKCELCAQASAPPPSSAPAEPQMEEKVRSEDSKSERRERQTGATGLRMQASKRRRRGDVCGPADLVRWAKRGIEGRFWNETLRAYKALENTPTSYDA